MEGLNHTEIRHLAEKIGEQPESHQIEPDKLAEFSVPSWLVSYQFFLSDNHLKGKVNFAESRCKFSIDQFIINFQG